jgi:hypothetical protein
MADAARIGAITGEALFSRGQRAAHSKTPRSFHQVLTQSLKAAPAGQTSSHQARSPIQPASARVVATRPAAHPAAEAALSQAMHREGVPPSWHDSLRFIMEKESGGRVDARNPVHSARGLFQLTRANYGYNPNGAASFGNATEEAQGGIRYIRQRYGTADKAVAFWQKHHWY